MNNFYKIFIQLEAETKLQIFGNKVYLKVIFTIYLLKINMENAYLVISWLQFEMLKKAFQQKIFSWHYHNSSKSQKHDKINLFGKAISLIDKLQAQQSIKLKAIKEIDLSHNAISMIQNLEQFQNVSILNLSHNKINSVESVKNIVRMKNLKKLLIKGNPFLKDQVTGQALQMLMMYQTDVCLTSKSNHNMLVEIEVKEIQILQYNNYLNKLILHIDLFTCYQCCKIQNSSSMFPKVKSILKDQSFNVDHVKRLILKKIQIQCFSKQQKLENQLKKLSMEADQKKSQLVRKIYDKQQSLIILRSTSNNNKIVHESRQQSRNQHQQHNQVPQSIIFNKPRNTQNIILKDKINSKQILRQLARSKIKFSSPSKLLQNHSANRKQANEFQFIEQNFLNIIMKLNPAFHLLHSPLASLKPSEKDLLINNLSLILKDKMKQVLKYQKSKVQFAEIQKQKDQLKQHLQILSAQIQSQKERIHRQQQIKINENQQNYNLTIKRLMEQNEIYVKEIKSLKAQIDRLNQIVEQQQNQSQKEEKNQQKQQSIRQRHDEITAKKYLGLLNYKAQHFKLLKWAKLKEIQRSNGEVTKKIFFQLYQSAKVSKKYKHFTQMKMRSLFQQFYSYAEQSFFLRKKMLLIRLNQTSKAFINFRSYLSQRNRTPEFLQVKFDKLKSNLISYSKRKVFNNLNAILDSKYQIQSLQRVKKYYGKSKIKKYFNLIKQHKKKQEQIINRKIYSTQSIIILKSLKLFIETVIKQMQFRSKLESLPLYLKQIRKIKNYHFLYQNLTSSLLRRKIKSQKLVRIRLHKSLFQFVLIMRDRVIKNKCQRLRTKQLKEVEQNRIKQNHITQKQMKLKKIEKFNTKIVSFYRKLRVEILNRFKKQFDISITVSIKQKLFFINVFRNKHVHQFKIKHKITLLYTSFIFRGKIRQFYKFLGLKLAKRKAKNTYYIKQNQIMREKLDQSSLIREVQKNYQKYQQQILILSQINEKYAFQKQVLANELQKQCFTIRNYEKTCQEYKFIIESKDMKYEKLRQIYQTAVRGQIQNTYIQDSNQQSLEMGNYTERNQQKNQTIGKYTLQAKDFIFKNINNPFEPIQIDRTSQPIKIQEEDQIASIRQFNDKYLKYYKKQMKDTRRQGQKQTQRKKTVNTFANKDKNSYSYQYF